VRRTFRLTDATGHQTERQAVQSSFLEFGLLSIQLIPYILWLRDSPQVERVLALWVTPLS